MGVKVGQTVVQVFNVIESMCDGEVGVTYIAKGRDGMMADVVGTGGAKGAKDADCGIEMSRLCVLQVGVYTVLRFESVPKQRKVSRMDSVLVRWGMRS